MGEGAHSNTVSKAMLHVGLEPVLAAPNTAYFPAFEILLDELRDYRWFAEDLVHPSPAAALTIWERFREALQ